MTLCPLCVQALPNWLAELQITNLDVSFCKTCKLDVVSQMTSLSVLSLQVQCHIFVLIYHSLNPCTCGSTAKTAGTEMLYDMLHLRKGHLVRSHCLPP